MAELGQILKRKPAASADLPARLKLIGVSGSSWVGQNADEFSAPILISPNDLRSSYVGADGEPVPVVDELQEWAKVNLDSSVKKARAAEQAAAPLPPEAKLRIEAEAEAAAE